jgi:hypothetical protein
LLNVNRFFDDLLNQLARAEEDGFLRSDHRGIFVADPTADALLQSLMQWRAPSPKRSVA